MGVEELESRLEVKQAVVEPRGEARGEKKGGARERQGLRGGGGGRRGCDKCRNDVKHQLAGSEIRNSITTCKQK